MHRTVNPLRILHVCAPAEFGGLESVVRALAREQDRRGHLVRVLAFVQYGREADHPFVRELVTDRVDVRAAGLRSRAYLAERAAVRAALADFRPDIVHTHGARVDVLDADVARRAGYPVVTTVHGFTGGGPRNRLYEILQRRAMRRAHAVVAVATAQVEVLMAADVPLERIRVVPNACAVGRRPMSRDAARAHLGLANHPGPVVGFVGRLTREKGADVLLNALARLPLPGVRAVFVGDGRERSALESSAARLGIADRLTWVGRVPDAGRTLPAFDVFVMSSRTEGTPMVLFEAMAAGVPVVATAVGGVPHVIGPGEAELVPPDTPHALAEAIERTLSDPVAAASRVAAAQVRLASAFAVQPWLDRYDAIYVEACRRSRSSPPRPRVRERSRKDESHEAATTASPM